MPAKNTDGYPKPDSIAANSDASRLFTSIVSSSIFQPGDKARKWYSHPSYIASFAPVSTEKLSMRIIQLVNGKYGDLTKHKLILTNIYV